MNLLLRATAIVLMLSLTIQIEAQTASVQCDTICTIRWTPPTQRVDGSAFGEAEIDFYSFYCDGTRLLDIDAVVGTWTAEISFGTPGQYVCALTVTDDGGRESAESNSKTFIKGVPNPMAPVLQ